MLSVSLIMSLLVTSAIAKGFQDRINFKGNFKSDWMIGAGKYHWSKRTWLLKYPLSFLSDGWHAFDSIKVSCLCVIATIALGIPVYWFISLYIGHGIIFELFYRLK